MAIGKASDFVVYQDEVRGGIVETLAQASNYFNNAGGALRLSSISRRGDYAKESFFKSISNLATRRDTTSTSAATDLALTMDEIISVKLNRKIGPVAQTRDAFRKVLMETGTDQFSFLVGTAVAKAMQVEMLNSALRAGRAALNNQAANKHTVASSGTMTTSDLVTGLSKLGDAANNVTALVMHSKVYFDLFQHQIGTSANGDVVSGAVVQGATPLTLNRPVIVTDSDALVIASGTGTSATTDYYTLGLTQDALVVENSEEEEVVVQDVTGLENLTVRMQGEYAFNLGVKGFKWDVTNGGANPADAAVGTGTNWDKAMASHKDLAGFVIQSK